MGASLTTEAGQPSDIVQQQNVWPQPARQQPARQQPVRQQPVQQQPVRQQPVRQQPVGQQPVRQQPVQQPLQQQLMQQQHVQQRQPVHQRAVQQQPLQQQGVQGSFGNFNQIPSLPPSGQRSVNWNLPAGTSIVPSGFADDEPLEIAAAGALPVYVSQPGAEPDPIANTGALTVKTRVEYSAMPRDQMQDIFGLVTVHAAEAVAAAVDSAAAGAEPERQPTDLVCVLDVSGSMQGDKLSQVQKALRFIVGEAEPKDRLSIVTFNHQAARPLGLKRMTAQGKDAANVATLRLTAGGGTSIAAGLDMALAVMEQRRERNKVSAILLLTDGQDNVTRSRLPQLLARVSKANCSLYAFGFGADHDAGLLSEIAEQARTPFTFVENAENCRDAFAGAVGGLSSIVAQGVELTLNCAATLKMVHTPFDVKRDGNGSRAVITIPDFFAGERRDILVELAVPAGEAGKAALLDASLRYTDLGQGCNVVMPTVQMEAARVDEPQPEMEPDEEVSAQRHRVEVTRALQEAARHGDEGNFEGARQVLTVCEKRLETGKQTKMSGNLCIELKDAQQRLRSKSSWEHGGRAEVKDACQMHSMQRCTNISPASGSYGLQKASKSMYVTSTQMGWFSQ